MVSTKQDPYTQNILLLSHVGEAIKQTSGKLYLSGQKNDNQIPNNQILIKQI